MRSQLVLEVVHWATEAVPLLLESLLQLVEALEVPVTLISQDTMEVQVAEVVEQVVLQQHQETEHQAKVAMVELDLLVAEKPQVVVVVATHQQAEQHQFGKAVMVVTVTQ
jgi:hypothetical protein